MEASIFSTVITHLLNSTLLNLVYITKSQLNIDFPKQYTVTFLKDIYLGQLFKSFPWRH